LSQDNSTELKLRERAKQLLEEVDLLIGYSQGSIATRVKPLFINGGTKQETELTEKLIFNGYCVNDLSVYAYSKLREIAGKIGIILKPCDVKSIVQLISEELISRKKIYAIVVGCSGVLDYKKILKQANGASVFSAKEQDGNLIIETAGSVINAKKADIYLDKCYGCTIYDKPPYFNEYIENILKPEINLTQAIDRKEDKYNSETSQISLLEKLEKGRLAEAAAFWEKEFGRCIRCYACRNICPLEVCRDRCISNLDSPRWQTQQITAKEGKFFQLIRVMHLAGRCTECGECDRACPQNIPILVLMRKMNNVVAKLFDYKAGMDIQQKPPLLTYKNIEKNITEEELV